MKIKMRETALGSPDGITVNKYEKGETYDVPDELAASFVGDELASATATGGRVGGRKKDTAESKDAGATPENKAE